MNVLIVSVFFVVGDVSTYLKKYFDFFVILWLAYKKVLCM